MKFRHLIEHLERIAELREQIEELREPHAMDTDVSLLPLAVYKEVIELERILETYLECPVEQKS